MLKKLNIRHFRFHDLRHYSASIQHALGIPDAYIMQRGGWEDDTVLKSIYRHAMDQEQDNMNKKANIYFEQTFVQHEMQHDTKKSAVNTALFVSGQQDLNLRPHGTAVRYQATPYPATNCIISALLPKFNSFFKKNFIFYELLLSYQGQMVHKPHYACA